MLRSTAAVVARNVRARSTLPRRVGNALSIVVPQPTIAVRPSVLQAMLYSTEVKSEKAGEEIGDESAEEPLSDIEKKLQELESEVEQAKKLNADLKDKYLRQVADFRNLQETTKREVQAAKDFAIQRFAKDLLDSVDNLDRAVHNIKNSQDSEGQQTESEVEEQTDSELIALFDGLKMTQEILESTLAKHGLAKVDPIGEKFDPHRHEATFEIAQPDKEPGTVFFVQQSGFTLNGRVLRPAKVGVVKGSE
ncbi:GrpE-domain-containing protein [Lipomyces oligophaga]|uniref:GrpE-domain-containing protein n=1 Tax=Lipomyces oligophaga TaxID=45792 RepID=UPI0034D003FE